MRTVRQPPHVIPLRVHLGDVSAEHLVEEGEEYRKQHVLHQRQPRRQILRRAEAPQEARLDGDDLKIDARLRIFLEACARARGDPR